MAATLWLRNVYKGAASPLLLELVCLSIAFKISLTLPLDLFHRRPMLSYKELSTPFVDGVSVKNIHPLFQVFTPPVTQEKCNKIHPKVLDRFFAFIKA